MKYNFEPSIEDDYCKICGNSVDECVCDACSICNVKGDPTCYASLTNKGHEMPLNDAQIKALNRRLNSKVQQKVGQF